MSTVDLAHIQTAMHSVMLVAVGKICRVITAEVASEISSAEDRMHVSFRQY